MAPSRAAGSHDRARGLHARRRYLNFEDDSGSIAVGKRADLIVLDRDPYTVPPNALHLLRVQWTLLDGREVFTADAFTP
jgi:predicted amidohydrolase YtcJ